MPCGKHNREIGVSGESAFDHAAVCKESNMVSIIFLAAAVLSAALGIFLIASGARSRRSCSIQTVGTVVGIHCSPSFEGDTFAPVVKFTAGGRNICEKARTEKGSSRRRVPYQIGDSIPVRYDPDHPTSFIVPGYDINMRAVLGIGSLLAALVLLFAAWFL